MPATESFPPPAADPRPRRARALVPLAVTEWFFTPGALVALFVVGLAIRVVLMRGGGFPFDMSSFGAWAGTLADKGPWNFYPFNGPDAFFVDYPPGYLYVLWIVGLVAKVFGGGGPSVAMIKLPGVLADLGLAWLVALLAERLTPADVARRVPVRALAAGAILLNPAVFFVSAVWGQADSVLAVLMVGAFLLLGTGEQTYRREMGGVALLALAFGTKPQAVFAIPIVVLLLAWRHLRRDVVQGSPRRPLDGCPPHRDARRHRRHRRLRDVRAVPDVSGACVRLLRPGVTHVQGDERVRVQLLGRGRVLEGGQR